MAAKNTDGVTHYSLVQHGAMDLTGNPQQLPDTPCSMAILCTLINNSGPVYVGGSQLLDLEMGLELQGSFPTTGWLAVDNLNRLWVVGTIHDAVSWLVMG